MPSWDILLRNSSAECTAIQQPFHRRWSDDVARSVLNDVGIAKQDQWIEITAANHGSGRHYDDELFCKADRMAWVYNVTDFEMARQLENDAMHAIVAVFRVSAHQDLSSIHHKSVSPTAPHAGYFMPTRPYNGNKQQFLNRMDATKKNTFKFGFADLGKQLDHTFGWKVG